MKVMVWVLCGGLMASTASAAELFYTCTAFDPADPKTVTGKNVDTLYPIASVSKVMTAYWALVKMGGDGRFKTQFHVRELPNGAVDLHLEGSRDPYTDQAMFQFAVGQLNLRGITKVRALSFDGNFKFRRDLRGLKTASSYLENAEPFPKTVKYQLDQMLAALNADYEFVRVKAAAVGVALPAELKLVVEKTEFLEKVSEGFARRHTHQSPPLRVLIKEMNRNSNNHAATQIFEALGGAGEFKKFASEKLGLGPKQLVFYNGSGNRLDLVGPSPKDPAQTTKKSVYNQATCRAVMKVTQALQEESDKQGFGIEQFLSVAGRATPGQEPGNISRYLTPETEGRLVAKTGTVAAAISIAGLVKTSKQPLYFAHVYKTAYSNEDWEDAREKLKGDIGAMMAGLELGAPIQYVPPPFTQFDAISAFSPPATPPGAPGQDNRLR